MAALQQIEAWGWWWGGVVESKPMCEGSPHLFLELHQINNLSVVLPHSNRLSILVDAGRLGVAPSRYRTTKRPQM